MLTFIQLSDPEHGCLELDPDTGALTYRPHASYVGSDSFQFQVDDGTGEENSLSNVAAVTITVTPLTPGFDLSGGVLTVIGTLSNDTIRLVRAGRGYNVVTNFGTFNVPNRAALTHMVVRARAGNDTVNVAALGPAQAADVYGGEGNDRIIGGAGHDIVLGEAGNDILTGGNGDDLLIGGAGSDQLVGSRGNDLLLAGILVDPCRELDLRNVLDDWGSAATEDDRLDAAQVILDRLLDDGALDMLTGGVGADLFVSSWPDRIIDRKPDDLIA